VPARDLVASFAEQLLQLAQTLPAVVERLLQRHAHVVGACVPQPLLELFDPAQNPVALMSGQYRSVPCRD
jgi:hypothetical protein